MVVVGVKGGDIMPSGLKCLIEWVFLIQKFYFISNCVPFSLLTHFSYIKLYMHYKWTLYCTIMQVMLKLCLTSMETSNAPSYIVSGQYIGQYNLASYIVLTPKPWKCRTGRWRTHFKKACLIDINRNKNHTRCNASMYHISKKLNYSMPFTRPQGVQNGHIILHDMWLCEEKSRLERQESRMGIILHDIYIWLCKKKVV